MPKSKTIIVTLICACTAAVAGNYFGRAARDDHFDREPTPFPLQIVNNGAEIGESEKAIIEVVLHNPTDRVVGIEDIKTKCDCQMLDPTPCGLTILPHGVSSFRFVANTTQRYSNQVDIPRRTFVFNLAAVLKDGRRTPLTVSRTVVSLATVKPTSIHFADWNSRNSTPHERKVRVTVHGPHEDIRATSDKPIVCVRTVRVSDNVYSLIVWPDTGKPAGEFKAVIRIEIRSAGKVVDSGIAIPIDGRIVEKAVGGR